MLNYFSYLNKYLERETTQAMAVLEGRCRHKNNNLILL